MHSHVQKRTAAMAIACLMLAGCGKAGPTANLPAGPMALRATDSVESKELIEDKLNLTTEQKAQIKAIGEKFKPQISEEEKTAFFTQLQSLLMAKEVDRVALKALLTPMVEKMDAFKAKIPEMLAEIREVLSEEQRKIIALALLKARRMGGHVLAVQEEDPKVNVSCAQRADIRAVEPKVSRKDIAAFMLSGDKEALNTAMVTTMSVEDRVDKMVDILAGLSLEKRQKLAEHILKAHGVKVETPEAKAVPEAPEVEAKPEVPSTVEEKGVESDIPAKSDT